VEGGWKEEGGGRREEGGGVEEGRLQPRPAKAKEISNVIYYNGIISDSISVTLLYISYGVQLPSELLIVYSFQTTGQVYFESHVFGYLPTFMVTELLSR
jgi:hypothetical protein